MPSFLIQTGELRRVVRFGVVGVFNTGLDIGLFSLMYFMLDVPLLAANTMSYLVAVTGSFILNKNWTFVETRNQGEAKQQFMLFVGLGLGGLILSNLTVGLLAPIMPEIAAKLASVIVLFAWNFTTSRMIVFRSRP